VGGIACLDGLDGWQKRNQTYGRNTHFPIFAFSFDRLELTLKQVVISIFIYYINKIFENILIPTAKKKRERSRSNTRR
jgi:hypothetical protein